MRTIIQQIELSIKKIANKQKYNYAVNDIVYKWSPFYMHKDPQLSFVVHLRKIPKLRKVKKKSK